MTFDVVHRTVYRYSQPVTVSQHAARVEPRSLPGQVVEDFSLRIEPAPPCARRATITSATAFAFSASRNSIPGWKLSPKAG
jgi:transglutaminase-like putative cysteine protease